VVLCGSENFNTPSSIVNPFIFELLFSVGKFSSWKKCFFLHFVDIPLRGGKIGISLKYASVPFVVNGLGWRNDQVIVTITAPPIFRAEPSPKNTVFTGLCFDAQIPPLTITVVLERFLLLKGILDLLLDPRSKVSGEPVDKIKGDQGRVPKFTGNLLSRPSP
jgi:hypothetical protein